MKTHHSYKRFLSALYALCAAVLIIAIAATGVSHIVSADDESPAPVNPDQAIHSSAVHQAILEQLLVIEIGSTGYRPATLLKQPTVGAISPDALVKEARYLGEITSNSGKRYALDIELLQIVDQVVPVAVTLNLIQETQS